MTTLPVFLRDQTLRSTVFSIRKQGGIFALHLNSPCASLPKNQETFSGRSTMLVVNRYNVSKSFRSTSRTNMNRTISYTNPQGPSASKQNQIESICVLLAHTESFAHKVQADVDSLTPGELQCAKQLRNLKERVNKEIDGIAGAVSREIIELKKFLSQLRRETGMQAKVNKRGVQEMTEKLIQICDGVGAEERHFERAKRLLEHCP